MRGFTLQCLCLLLPCAIASANTDVPNSLTTVSAEYVNRLEAASGELVNALQSVGDEPYKEEAETK